MAAVALPPRSANLIAYRQRVTEASRPYAKRPIEEINDHQHDERVVMFLAAARLAKASGVDSRVFTDAAEKATGILSTVAAKNTVLFEGEREPLLNLSGRMALERQIAVIEEFGLSFMKVVIAPGSWKREGVSAYELAVTLHRNYLAFAANLRYRPAWNTYKRRGYSYYIAKAEGIRSKYNIPLAEAARKD